ncbi:MAG: glycosyltransferase family 2 protein [Clostridia bacterium]|nr:glycosyltransferase family 2 protein [Clostridia bacterium]
MGGEVTVTILLAVYNGEKYLKQQLDSILAQTVKDIKIVIRDDGSRDNSPAIIDEYCNNYPQTITKLEGAPTGGAKQNFATLFESCDDDYIMFCDQDDVWLPHKVEKTLDTMRQNEQDGKIPVLVHSDLKVVDSDLKVISNSFFDFQKLNQNDITLPKILVQNYVTGCTVMVNRALKQKCGSIPNDCIMHDWWLALVAVLFGKLVCIDEPTMLYRQHSDNQVGAKASYGIAFITRKLATLSTVRKNYNDTYVQAELALKRYGECLSDYKKDIIATYCQIKKMNKCKKIKTVKKYGFKKCTRLRVWGQYILM